MGNASDIERCAGSINARQNSNGGDSWESGAEKWKYVKQQPEKKDNQCTEVQIDGVLCPPGLVRMEIGLHECEKEIEKYY